MEKINTILDRKPLNSEYINSKQDFTKVMDGFKQLKPPIWKSGWFYGAVGLAAVAVIFTVVSVTSPDEETSPTLATTNTTKTTSFDQTPTEPESAISVTPKADAPVEVEPIVPEVVKPIPVREKPPAPSVEQIIPEEEPIKEPIVEKPAKITQPHIAGVFNGPISFEDFCDPMGIQVNEGVNIVEYTIHYSSCSQEVTARIRGSKIPLEVCNELRSCGKRIEISISNIKGYDRKTNNPVKYSGFVLIPNV